MPGIAGPRVGDLWIYRDEIKPERGAVAITGHGSLIVPAAERLALYTHLQLLRQGFAGRLHYTRTRNGGPRYETTWRFIDEFFAALIGTVSFKATFCLHDQEIPLPYPDADDAIYQRHWVMGTKANLLGHIRWVHREFDVLFGRPVFDATDNSRERNYAQWGVEHAQFEINRRRREGKVGYPQTWLNRVVFQSSDPSEAQTLEGAINAEFLQLTDILLGASADSLQFLPGVFGKAGRRRLAALITDQIAVRGGRSTYAYSHHLRSFSVSLYPDNFGRMYAARPLPKRTQARGEQGALLV